MKAYQALKVRLLEVDDLNRASAVLQWDQATYMPPGGAAARGRQVATLSRLAHEAFTAVDAFFAPVVFRIATYQLQLSQTAQHYQSLMIELPAMRAWYDDALQEPWRELSHEQDIAKCGSIIADYRSA